MKKLVLNTFAFLLAAITAYAGNYETNLRTISDNGTTIVVAVEARSVTTAIEVGKNGNDGIVHTITYGAGLTFSSGTVDAAFVNFSTQTVTNTSTTTTITITEANGSGNDVVSIPVGPTWTNIATITYTYANKNAPQNFVFATTNYSHNNASHTLDNAFDKITFAGAWSGGNGTAGAPASGIADACKRINVTSGSATISTGDVQCDYINITSPATLTIAPGASITAWNLGSGSYVTSAATFIIDADNTGYGQFIGGPVALTAKQYWSAATGRWINMGFPLTSLANLDLGGAPVNTTGGTSAICVPDGSGTWGNPVNTTNLYEFTSGNAGSPCNTTIEHEWQGCTPTGPSSAPMGHNVFFGGTGSFASTGIVSVEGASQTSASFGYTQSTPHATGSGSQNGTGNESNWDGWRLLANPFTCNLDVAAFATDNSISPLTISIWNGSAYTTTTGSVAPFQAFWIKLAANQTLNFTADHAVIGTATVQKTSTLGDNVSIMVTNGTTTSDAHLYFESQATLGFDNLYDGYKLMNLAANTPNIALLEEYVSQSGNTVRNPMGYNAVPAPVGPQAYPLIFKNITAENHTISIDPSVLPLGYTVAIEDKLVAPGVLHDITNAGYAFSHAGASADPLRFVLHVNAGSIGIEENALLEGLSAWVNQGQLYFSNELPANAEVEVYNTAGQVVTSTKGNNALYLQQNGVYIISVKTNNGEVKNLKVVKM